MIGRTAQQAVTGAAQGVQNLGSGAAQGVQKLGSGAAQGAKTLAKQISRAMEQKDRVKTDFGTFLEAEFTRINANPTTEHPIQLLISLDGDVNDKGKVTINDVTHLQDVSDTNNGDVFKTNIHMPPKWLPRVGPPEIDSDSEQDKRDVIVPQSLVKDVFNEVEGEVEDKAVKATGGRKTKRIRRYKSKRRSTNKARPRSRKAGSRKAKR